MKTHSHANLAYLAKISETAGAPTYNGAALALVSQLAGLFSLQTTALDASTNPNYPAASQGYAQLISVAGKVGGASGKDVAEGDIIAALDTNAGGTEAAVGTAWLVIPCNLGNVTAAGLAIITAASAAAQAALLSLATTDRPQFANLRLTESTLTYAASVQLDFDGNRNETVTLTGAIAFTTANLAAGREKRVRIIGDASSRALTFPAGWTFLGAAAPASLAANKSALLKLHAFGATDAAVLAEYSAEP